MIWRGAALCTALAAPAGADVILSATYTAPTTRYAHGVLGDAVEWGTLEVEVGKHAGTSSGLFSGKLSLTWRFTLPEELVFEDTEPRLWDVTGDGNPEVVVVQSHRDFGARLLVLGVPDGASGQDAAPIVFGETPFIGRASRWLAAVGAAGLDGDGKIEVAYIDRPHLAKTLRVWRFENGLSPVTDLAGLTNHRIGEADIGGGIRDCGGSPEIITANGNWSRVIATTLSNGALKTRDIGAHVDRGSFATALACEPLP